MSSENRQEIILENIPSEITERSLCFSCSVAEDSRCLRPMSGGRITLPSCRNASSDWADGYADPPPVSPSGLSAFQNERELFRNVRPAHGRLVALGTLGRLRRRCRQAVDCPSSAAWSLMSARANAAHCSDRAVGVSTEDAEPARDRAEPTSPLDGLITLNDVHRRRGPRASTARRLKDGRR